MDALGSLRLASDVVQFVHFASQVISSTKEIYQSSEGATDKTLELEHVCDSLHTFHSKLCGNGGVSSSSSSGLHTLFSYPTGIQTDRNVAAYVGAIETLAAECNSLCIELLQELQKLKAADSSRRPLKSAILAFRTLHSGSHIQDLERRIDSFQKAIGLNFFPLLSYQQWYMHHTLINLRDESHKLWLDQSEKLDNVLSRLREVKDSLPSGADDVSFVQTEEDEEGNMVIKEAIRRQDDVTKMEEREIQSLLDGISQLSVTRQGIMEIAREQTFLRTLNFDSRPLRHDDIPVAHQRTFQWVLDPPASQDAGDGKQTSPLRTWLASDGGIFWICGKAGSGKSTLIKYLADHPQTRQVLQTWASGHKLAVASHYFWAAGTPMQKSQKGLLQSLLYDIFGASTDLIEQVCASRWSVTEPRRTTGFKEWSAPELLSAIRAVAQRRELPTRYCLFIDGLDEFDGEHFDMCKLLVELSKSPHFKICLSSRPWNVFEDAFGSSISRKLYVHDLTRPDILHYTQDKLSAHWRWNELYLPRDQMHSMLQAIATKANGVFLWVFLVTRSLGQGLINGDTMQDLQRRLDSFPADLDGFFKHMLDIVDPLYHQQMAQLLCIAVNARQALKLEVYQVHEYNREDGDYPISKSVDSHLHQRLSHTLDQCRRRIKARCGGLLEVKNDRVEFLHRTVRDFLRTKDMSEYLSERSGRDFTVNHCTLKAFMFLFKCWMQSSEPLALGDDQSFWREGLQYANDAIDEDSRETLRHLDAVEDWYGTSHGLNDYDLLAVTPDSAFRSEIIQAGLFNYVKLKLEADPTCFDSVFEPPLWTALDHGVWNAGHMNIVNQLLQAGHNPNDIHNGLSPWQRFVQHACCSDAEDNFLVAVQMSTFSCFLRYGAEKHTRVWDASGTSRVELDKVVQGNSRGGCYDTKSRRFAASRFIEAVFSYSSAHRLSEKCLGILRDFLHYRNPAERKLQVRELVEILRAQITVLGRIQDSQYTERVRFYAKVMETVIEAGTHLEVDLTGLKKAVLAVFPKRIGKELTNKSPLTKATAQAAQPRPRGKRSALQGADVKPSRKKSRKHDH